MSVDVGIWPEAVQDANVYGGVCQYIPTIVV